MSILRIIVAAICIFAGLVCMRIRTDQEFHNIPPIDAPAFVMPMQSGVTYEQPFIIQRKTIDRIGIYMRPLEKIADATSAVHIELVRSGVTIGSGDISAIFIENGGPSYVTFPQPIVTAKGENVVLKITVPEQLSGVIAIRQQEHGIAYNLFESIRPPFIKQVGGMLIMAAFALLFWKKVRTYPIATSLIALLCIAVLYALPAYDASMSYGFFALSVYAILCLMWALLRVAGRPHVWAIFGACVFACSTWLPLHVITGGTIGDILSVRNALIDPNQIAITHGAGLYSGVLAAAVAATGVFAWIILLIQKQHKRFEVETAVVILGVLAGVVAFIPSPIANGHAGILVSFAIGWFASFGVWQLSKLLGEQDFVARSVLTGLAIITVLDLMYVTARTFTYGLGL